MSGKHLIVITGPTASGKTDLSIRVARHFHTEIISADSRQFYRDMNLGTAKPDKLQLASIPHHFINSLDIGQDYNIGKYETDALLTLETIFRKHDYAVVCGGSGLYIKIITEGMDELPETDPELRRKLTEEWNEIGPALLTARLKKLDPDYYQQVDLKNKHRVIRALEIIETSGKPFSSFRTNTKKERPFHTHYFAIEIPRDELYSRINRRVDDMIADGLVEEVRSLLPFRNANAMQTVGYREFFDYFDNTCTLEEAIEKVKQNTRNYAKRQMTWIKKVNDVTYLSPNGEEIIYQKLKPQI